MPDRESVFGAFARIAGSFVSAPPEGARNVWGAVAPWINDLSRSATERWLPYLLHAIPCEIVFREGSGKLQRCTGAAVAACSICKKPCCLDHSFVSRFGDACCFACVQRAQAQQTATRAANGEMPKAGWAPPPPPPPPPPHEPPPPKPSDEHKKQLALARKILGVKRAATADEIRTAYKKLAFRWHPDRNAGSTVAAERFRAAQEAYELLMKEVP